MVKNRCLTLKFIPAGIMLLLVTISGCYGTVHVKDEKPGRPESLNPVAIERGGLVYNENCLVCHGQSGQGNGPKAQQFDPPPSDLTKSGLHITTTGIESIIDYPGYSAKAMRRRIRHGSMNMPDFKNEFTETEIRDIISYIRYLELSGGKDTTESQ